jgi:SAM-dependent methyltransferase
MLPHRLRGRAYDGLVWVQDAKGTVFGRFRFLAARDLIYTSAYYQRIDSSKPLLYERIVEVLHALLQLRTAVDVGCGSGVMLASLEQRGVVVRGVEGSRAAIRRSGLSGRVMRANLERGVPDLGRFDLCLCIEVAEHLSPESGPGLVDGLTRLSDIVVFSAAAPGQTGTGHLNERPQSYWRELFGLRGFHESPLHARLHEAIADIPEPWWIHQNLVVFEAVR